MTSVETRLGAALPDTSSDDLFEVSGLVRIIGVSGRITAECDDPYSITVKVGADSVSSVTLGGQPSGKVISGGSLTADAGESFGREVIAYDGAVISVTGSDDPGSGAAEWVVLYEPLEPNATIVAA